jgi:hypothetical protein
MAGWGNCVRRAGVSYEKEASDESFTAFRIRRLVVVIGALAASSVYVTERNDATMRRGGIQPAPIGHHGRARRTNPSPRDLLRTDLLALGRPGLAPGARLYFGLVMHGGDQDPDHDDP